MLEIIIHSRNDSYGEIVTYATLIVRKTKITPDNKDIPHVHLHHAHDNETQSFLKEMFVKNEYLSRALLKNITLAVEKYQLKADAAEVHVFPLDARNADRIEKITVREFILNFLAYQKDYNEKRKNINIQKPKTSLIDNLVLSIYKEELLEIQAQLIDIRAKIKELEEKTIPRIVDLSTDSPVIVIDHKSESQPSVLQNAGKFISSFLPSLSSISSLLGFRESPENSSPPASPPTPPDDVVINIRTMLGESKAAAVVSQTPPTSPTQSSLNGRPSSSSVSRVSKLWSLGQSSHHEEPTPEGSEMRRRLPRSLSPY